MPDIVRYSENPVWLVRSGGGGGGSGDFRITILDPTNPIKAGVYLNATPYRVRAGPGRSVTLIEFAMQVKHVAIGADLVVDVEVSHAGAAWTSIFLAAEKPTIPSGAIGAISTSFEITTLAEDDLIRYNVITPSGGGFEGILRGKVS